MVEFARMVDLHCHYLPAVDDGAANLNEGLDLIRAAHDNGISRILLTPHIHVGRYDNTNSSLQTRFETFRRAITAANIPVEIALAAEVRCSDDLFGLIEQEEVPFLLDAKGNKTLLLEMPHSHVPPGVDQLVRWLLKRNIRPMLAHPERNKEFMKYPHRLADLCSAGCLTQITAAAVIGRFGEKSQHAAHALLNDDLVSVIATDAHNLQHRPPLLREAANWVAQNFGEERAWRLVGATPAALSTGNFYRRAAQPRKSVAVIATHDLNLREAPQVAKPITVESFNSIKTAPTAGTDFCEQAFSRLREKLNERAAQPGGAGSKAARTLAIMDDWRVR
ncbi:MAG: capsular biosynthesis protein [Verrucomicrobiaceae bacterium]|nr:capsular biosynthesis protein [Verrucomicrobiaceae bacterium]